MHICDQSVQFYGTAVFVFQNLQEKVFVKNHLLSLDIFNIGLAFVKVCFLHFYIWVVVKLYYNFYIWMFYWPLKLAE